MLARFLYRSYSFFYAADRWRKHHVMPAGTLMLATLFLSGLFGMNILKTSLYQVAVLAFFFVAAGLVVSLNPFKFNTKIKRHLPDYIRAGDSFSYEIEITNLTDKAQKGLVLFEDVLDPRPSLAHLLAKKEPFEHLRNIWDRNILYFRWRWLIQKGKNVLFEPVYLPDLPAKETIRVKLEMKPLYRGYIHFSGVTLGRPDIFGMFNRLTHVRQPEKILVLPPPLEVDIPHIESRRQYHSRGIQLASSIGNSDEFMGLRQYRPGDPLRNVHWKSFAKTGELVIKEFEDEFFQRHALVLDTNASAQHHFVFEQAVSIASHLVGSLKTADGVLDLMFAGNQNYFFTCGRGLGQTRKMLEILACIQSDSEFDITALQPVLKENMTHFSRAVCLFLDWSDGHQKIVELFRQAAIPFHVIVLAEDTAHLRGEILKQNQTMAGIQMISINLFETKA